MRNPYREKLEGFYARERRMPSYSEMAKLFGYKSKNAVYKLVGKMVDAGLVVKDKLGRIVPSQSFGEIPMVGLVKAGPPTEAEELYDTVDLDEMLIRNKALTYMLEVDGDSMIEAHIEEGDHVLVEKATVARDKDIVIAEVDGEFTMKYFRRDGNKVWLEPANRSLKNIYPERSLNIVGIVKAVIRKY
jgi:SOS regulatory protein LexA